MRITWSASLEARQCRVAIEPITECYRSQPGVTFTLLPRQTCRTPRGSRHGTARNPLLPGSLQDAEFHQSGRDVQREPAGTDPRHSEDGGRTPRPAVLPGTQQHPSDGTGPIARTAFD